MSVSDVTGEKFHNGDNSTTAFTFPFPILASSELEVYVGGTLKTITTHYSVTINSGSEGGSVTFVSAPASGTNNVLIRRVTSLAQGSSIGNTTRFSEKTVVAMVDKLHRIAVEHGELLKRCIKTPVTDGDSDDDRTIEIGDEDKGVKFDADGNLVQTDEDIDGIATAAAASAAAASASATNAASSASAASASASSASTSATNAASSASTAATQASNAATSATNAASSASSASSSASSASTSATNAASSASSASTSATNAASSASSASTSATNAASSATSASNSAAAASTSETNAASSASAAASSATAAAASAASVSYNKVSKTFSNFSAAATSATSAMATVAQNRVLEKIVVKSTTVFSGAGITGLVLNVGISGDETKFLASYNLLTAVADSHWQIDMPNEAVFAAAGLAVVIQLVSTGANLDALTQGAFDVQYKLGVLA